jgi:quercetin dioxygenase-like cupin family protein
MITSAQPTSALPLVLPPGGGERIWITGDTVKIKATAADTRGALTVLEVEAAPGSGPPPHLHGNEDESFYVLEGTFELLIGERTVLLEPGAFALVPRGVVHRFRNAGDRPGRMLILFTPGGLEGFFREAGAAAAADSPVPPVDEAEIARTEVAGERYGLRVVDWEE